MPVKVELPAGLLRQAEGVVAATGVPMDSLIEAGLVIRMNVLSAAERRRLARWARG